MIYKVGTLITLLVSLSSVEFVTGDSSALSDANYDLDNADDPELYSAPEFERFQASVYPPGIEYCERGLKLTILNRYDNPSILSKYYIESGRAEVELQAAPGQGIISSFYLQSPSLDEIDVAETFGSNPYEFQSNFFIRGNTSTHDRGEYHPMYPPPMDVYHKYGIEWTEDHIEWFIDGESVRTVYDDHPQGFPRGPMSIKFSLWAGGDALNDPGTIEWSGGNTDYYDLPYSMYIKDMNVVDYSTGVHHSYGNSFDDWIDLTAKNGIDGLHDDNDKFEIVESAFRDPSVFREKDAQADPHFNAKVVNDTGLASKSEDKGEEEEEEAKKVEEEEEEVPEIIEHTDQIANQTTMDAQQNQTSVVISNESTKVSILSVLGKIVALELFGIFIVLL